MHRSNLLAATALLSVLATPVAAAPVVNPAASLSLAPAAKFRAVTQSSRKNNILGLPLLALLAAAAAVTAVTVVVASSDSSSS